MRKPLYNTQTTMSRLNPPPAQTILNPIRLCLKNTMQLPPGRWQPPPHQFSMTPPGTGIHATDVTPPQLLHTPSALCQPPLRVYYSSAVYTMTYSLHRRYGARRVMPELKSGRHARITSASGQSCWRTRLHWMLSPAARSRTLT